MYNTILSITINRGLYDFWPGLFRLIVKGSITIEIQEQCDNWKHNEFNFRCTEFGRPLGVHI